MKLRAMDKKLLYRKAYKILDNVIFANYRGKVYKVDFANLEDGEMNESNVVFISKKH